MPSCHLAIRTLLRHSRNRPPRTHRISHPSCVSPQWRSYGSAALDTHNDERARNLQAPAIDLSNTYTAYLDFLLSVGVGTPTSKDRPRNKKSRKISNALHSQPLGILHNTGAEYESHRGRAVGEGRARGTSHGEEATGQIRKTPSYGVGIRPRSGAHSGMHSIAHRTKPKLDRAVIDTFKPLEKRQALLRYLLQRSGGEGTRTPDFDLISEAVPPALLNKIESLFTKRIERCGVASVAQGARRYRAILHSVLNSVGWESHGASRRLRVSPRHKSLHRPRASRSSQSLPTLGVHLPRYWRQFFRIREHTQRHGAESPPEPPIMHTMTIHHVERIYEGLGQETSLGQKDPIDSLHYGFLRGGFEDSLWPYIMLWVLHYDPDRALEFLVATHDKEHPPYALSWVLFRIALHYRNDDQGLQRLWAVYTHLKQDVPNLHLSGAFYHFFMVFACTRRLLELFEHFKENFAPEFYHWATWLQLAMAFARKDQCDRALEALLKSKQAGAAVGNFPFLSVCSTILRRSIRMPGELRVCLRMVEHLTEIGVPLDSHLSAIIMLNAVEAGDTPTALSIYHSLHRYGLKGDAYHYGALLKACKINIDNVELLNEVIRATISNINVLEAPGVATEILHCLALHHTKHNPEKAYATVTEAFDQLFDVAPLQQLGILPSKLDSQPVSDEKRPLPPAPAMYVLLATFLEQAFLRTSSTAIARELWQRLTAAMADGQEPFAEMCQTDHIFNLFLAQFTQTRKGLLSAAEVVKYMQHPTASGAKYPRASPSVQTWSIFLHGFSRHGQMQLAEQVLGYMRNKGIEPSQVTYNSLLGGYAAKQDLEGVLNTVRRLEADGRTWDAWTLSNARRLRGKARHKMDAITRERQAERTAGYLDFTSDLKQSIGEKLQGVEEPTMQEGVRHVESEASGRASGIESFRPL